VVGAALHQGFWVEQVLFPPRLAKKSPPEEAHLALLAPHCCHDLQSTERSQEKKTKRKDYTFRRQFDEKPSVIPGCPGPKCYTGLPRRKFATCLLVSDRCVPDMNWQ